VKTDVEVRRTERVLLKVPIKVQGANPEGKTFSENTHTLVINRHGARIAVRAPLRPGDEIKVTNLYSNLTYPFRVVCRVGKSLGEGPEWGVECLEPEANVWGIQFPQKKRAPGEVQSISALLECTQCASRELVEVAQGQYRTLIREFLLRRNCLKCGTTTAWQFSFVDDGWEESSSLAQAAPAVLGAESTSDLAPQPLATSPTVAPLPAAAAEPAPVKTERKERRRVKRVTLKLPVRIRLQDGQQDVTRTENFSKPGACVISKLALHENASVLLTMGYTGGSGDLEAPARVVWQKPMEGTQMVIYGVDFESKR